MPAAAPRRAPHRLPSIALLAVGVLLPLAAFAALAGGMRSGFGFDAALLWRAHALAGPALDRAAIALSFLGYEGVIVLDTLLVLALLGLRRWHAAAFAATACIGSALLNLGAKPLFERARPALWPSVAPEPTLSFPSGHAMGSMTLATVAVLLAWPTRWRWPVLACAALFVLTVGLSRVYLGVHFPSDVLAGWTAACAWVVASYAALRVARG